MSKMRRITSYEDFERIFGFEVPKADEIGLQNIKDLLNALGNPEKKLTNVIHIAGTNGKGSTAAMIHAIAIEHGLTSGLNTSPHLFDFSERVKINNKNIESETLYNILTHISEIALKSKIKTTFFEAMTAVAALHFANKKVDVSIFETGLGGRFDATNTIPSTTQVITPISIDHQEFLGNTIEKIAPEKAGIIKKNSNVLTTNSGTALTIIANKTKEKNSTLTHINPTEIKNITITLQGTQCTYNNQQITTNLIGAHQAQNAILAFETCKKSLPNFSPSKALKGLQKTQWPARFQVTSKKPLRVLDGSHNKKGIETFIKTCKALKITNPTLLVSIKKTKDYQSIIKKLLKISSNIIAIETEKPNMIAAKDIQKISPENISVKTKAEATKLFKSKKSEPIITTGSLYTVEFFTD